MVLSCAFGARGQEAQGSTAATSTIPTVTAATTAAEFTFPEVEILTDPLEASRKARAAQSSVIDAQKFAQEGRTVAEMLATAPGVVLHANGGPMQETTVSLRGASADESLVLLDGIPLQGPGGGTVDMSTIPSTLLERIVVSRGVLGAQLGAGALGGAIELLPREIGTSTHGGALVSFGSWLTMEAAADVTAPIGNSGGVTAAVQLDRSSGDFGFARQLTPEQPDSPFYADTRQNADGKRGAALVRFEDRPTAATRFSLLFEGTAGERGLPGPVGNTTPHARAQDQGGVFGGQVQVGLADTVLSARAWVRGARVVIDGLIQGFADCVPGSPGCPRTESHTVATHGEAEWGLPLGAHQWLSVLAGGGEEWEVGDTTGRHRRTTATGAVTDEVKLLTGRLELHPSVRLDRVGDDTALSPGLNVAVRPVRALPGFALRAGVGDTFRAPTFSELYLDQGATAPNPNLSPERATSVDAGVSYVDERVSLSAGGFATFYRDLILYDLYPPARTKPFNAGAARMLGAEVQGVAKLPLGLTGSLAYSFLDARSEVDTESERGQQLPYRPPHRLFLRLAHQSDRVEGFAELIFTSATPRNVFGTSTLRAQASVNAGAFVRAIGPLWLGAEVRNAFDDLTQQDLFQYPLPGIQFTALARARL
ncbi:MAG: TonB-dependent receptor [Deltaproteobacteria bacterium]|nr:TonB-dependent receptor [Deltaproteobacteria bacterium]